MERIPDTGPQHARSTKLCSIIFKATRVGAGSEAFMLSDQAWVNDDNWG